MKYTKKKNLFKLNKQTNQKSFYHLFTTIYNNNNGNGTTIPKKNVDVDTHNKSFDNNY